MIPKALGPYSAYRKCGNFVYLSGQLGLDPQTNELKEGIEAQCTQALENIKAILSLENLQMDDIVKSTILLSNIQDFALVNEIYGKYFKNPYPARSAFEVANLPKGGLIEIEVIAYRETN